MFKEQKKPLRRRKKTINVIDGSKVQISRREIPMRNVQKPEVGRGDHWAVKQSDACDQVTSP